MVVMKKIIYLFVLSIVLFFTGCASNKSESLSLEDRISDCLEIDGNIIKYTNDIVVIPAGETKIVKHQWGMPDYRGKGSFYWNTKELKAYALGQYEVTQEFYEAVMKVNPSAVKDTNPKFAKMFEGEESKYRPVDSVTFNHIMVFCNRLSKMMGLEPCYKIVFFGKEVDWENITYEEIPYHDGEWGVVTCDYDKNGYRLPTNEEWEYAARGGYGSRSWTYSYAGVNTQKSEASFSERPYEEENLEKYGWFWDNITVKEKAFDFSKKSERKGYGSHQVGLKKPNSLGFYDMSGNICEYAGGPERKELTQRGGGWNSYAFGCSVSNIEKCGIIYAEDFGFRICRTLK